MRTNKDILPFQGLLNGIGQVYFTQSATTSLLLLLSISIESLWLSFMTLIGAASSHLLACYSHKPSQDIENGLYALNGALVALFIGNIFGVTPVLTLLAIVGALLTVPIAHIVFQFKTYRGYTSAFILVSWLIYSLYTTLNWSSFNAEPSVPFPLINVNIGDWINLDEWLHIPSILDPLLKGISQVSFIENALSGIVILVAIALNNLKHALWVVASVVISTNFSNAIGVSDALVEQGLYGYNAVLVTLALLLYKGVTWPLIVLGIVASSLITLGFHELSLLPLTGPFILSTWGVVYLSRLMKRSRVNS